MELDLTPFNNALIKLIQGLKRFQLDTSDDQVSEGLIQRFKFTYELAHKMMRRYLAESSANIESIHELSFQGLIRTASDKNLIKGNWSNWSTYREMRGKTSYTYDESIAIQVVEGIPAFIDEAVYMQKTLMNKCQN